MLSFATRASPRRASPHPRKSPAKKKRLNLKHAAVCADSPTPPRPAPLRFPFPYQNPTKQNGPDRREKVLMNGHDIKAATQQSVRRAIGVVPQDTVMFNDTVLHNVRYGRMDATMQEVRQTADSQADSKPHPPSPCVRGGF